MNDLLNLEYIKYFFATHRMNEIREEMVLACQKKLEKPHGDVHNWQMALDKLPKINNVGISIDKSINLYGKHSFDDSIVEEILKIFCPWRKGPFQFLNTYIDTEWNSLLKWERLCLADIDFSEKNVLDVGCGNGAFMWLISQSGANSVTGIDPMWLFYHQFMVFQQYIRSPNLCFLPLGIEDLPLKSSFDCVLSMGVLYHRKSPLDHIFQLKNMVKKGGEVIIETIILPDDKKTLLTPIDRYAGMRNVWMIPSKSVLCDWVIKTGLNIINVSEPVKTTLDEQKQSDWMDFHSLNHFLDKKDNRITVEGYPAPYRIIIVANR